MTLSRRWLLLFFFWSGILASLLQCVQMMHNRPYRKPFDPQAVRIQRILITDPALSSTLAESTAWAEAFEASRTGIAADLAARGVKADFIPNTIPVKGEETIDGYPVYSYRASSIAKVIESHTADFLIVIGIEGGSQLASTVIERGNAKYLCSARLRTVLLTGFVFDREGELLAALDEFGRHTLQHTPANRLQNRINLDFLAIEGYSCAARPLAQIDRQLLFERLLPAMQKVLPL